MAATTHVNEYYGNEEVMTSFEAEWNFDEICDFFYERQGDGKGNFDWDKFNSCPEFTITVEGGDERCDFYEENRYTVRLPSREEAEELASLIGGKLTSDGTATTGSKQFRITYRNEVYISADSEEEAQAKFRTMARNDLDHLSAYVEQVSCEEVK